MAALIGVVSCYNEEISLRRCLLSLRGHVDTLVVVDGAYCAFPHERPYSADQTLAIAAEFADEVIGAHGPWPDEIAKRNQYLIGKPGDYYLMLDADEEFIGELPELVDDDYEIELRRTDHVSPYPVYRLFKHREGIKYEGTHHALWVDGELINKRPLKTLEGCYIKHYIGERDEQRKRDKGIYYERLRLAEMSVRKHYNL